MLATLALFWPLAKLQPLMTYDQPFYIGIADDILRHGRFTDGEFGPPGHPPGMRFAPLYPALLAGLAGLDPSMARNFDCVAAGVVCGRGAAPVRWLQFTMLAAAYWLVWDIAILLGLGAGAWVALGLALLTAPLMLLSVNYLMTETTSFLLSTAMTAGLVRGAGGRPGWAWPTGLALGLAILVRPAFLYLAYALLACGFWRVTAGAAVLVLPWIARNEAVLGRAQLTFGYAGHTLAQRISFDSMTWREYGLSFPCWLPDGNAIGRLFAGPAACARFGWDERPEIFSARGWRRGGPEPGRAAGGPDNHLHWLLVHEVARDPVWHLMVTVPLALRGLWVDHYWGLVLAPICVWTMVRRRDAGFLAVSLPAFFLLAFNAAFAVNQVRYNFMLIPALAIAGADASRRIWSAMRARATAT